MLTGPISRMIQTGKGWKLFHMFQRSFCTIANLCTHPKEITVWQWQDLQAPTVLVEPSEAMFTKLYNEHGCSYRYLRTEIPLLWIVTVHGCEILHHFAGWSPKENSGINRKHLSGWWFQPLWKIWKSIGIIIPNTWENKSHVPVTTNTFELVQDFAPLQLRTAGPIGRATLWSGSAPSGPQRWPGRRPWAAEESDSSALGDDEKGGWKQEAAGDSLCSLICIDLHLCIVSYSISLFKQNVYIYIYCVLNVFYISSVLSNNICFKKSDTTPGEHVSFSVVASPLSSALGDISWAFSWWVYNSNKKLWFMVRE